MIEVLVYLAAAAMLVFGLGPMVLDGLRSHRLKANGLPAKATVLSITDTRSRVNGNPVVDLSLSVESGGAAYTAGLRAAISPVDLPRYQPGQTVDILVDRNDRQHVGLPGRP